MILAALALSAHADIAAMPDAGERFVTHRLKVEGLAAHPGYVLLALDTREVVSDFRAWTTDGVQDLAHGGNNRGVGLTAPTLRLMPADAYTAWRAATDAEVEKQRQACYERNEGCVHESRFVPRITPPKGLADCDFPVPLLTEGPADGADTVTQGVELTQASATTCLLREKPRVYERGGKPFTPPGGCDTTGGAASTVAALGLLGLARVRWSSRKRSP